MRWAELVFVFAVSQREVRDKGKGRMRRYPYIIIFIITTS